jgi:hypothetical protein
MDTIGPDGGGALFRTSKAIAILELGIVMGGLGSSC